MVTYFTLYFFKVGFTEVGQLNGISLTYYGDCGMNPNDNSLPLMQIWADNGTLLAFLYYNTCTSSNIRQSLDSYEEQYLKGGLCLPNRVTC